MEKPHQALSGLMKYSSGRDSRDTTMVIKLMFGDSKLKTRARIRAANARTTLIPSPYSRQREKGASWLSRETQISYLKLYFGVDTLLEISEKIARGFLRLKFGWYRFQNIEFTNPSKTFKLERP
jgi:hypothetical protein